MLLAVLVPHLYEGCRCYRQPRRLPVTAAPLIEVRHQHRQEHRTKPSTLHHVSNQRSISSIRSSSSTIRPPRRSPCQIIPSNLPGNSGRTCVATQLGARAGGSHGPVVNSSVSASSLSLPHLVAVSYTHLRAHETDSYLVF